MNITNVQRDEALAAATPQQEYSYSHPDSGARMRKIADKYGIVDRAMYVKYAIIVGDVVLNLLPKAELPSALSTELEISIDKALQITGDIIDFLEQPVPAEDISDDISEAEALLEGMSQTNSNVPTPPPPEEPVYSNSQESILAPREVPVPPPAPTTNAVPTPPPTWGSDN